MTGASTDQSWIQIWCAHWKEPEVLADKADFTSGTGNSQEELGAFRCSGKHYQSLMRPFKRSQKTANGLSLARDAAMQQRKHQSNDCCRLQYTISTEKASHSKRENFEETEFRIQLTSLQKNSSNNNNSEHQIALSEGKKMTGFQLTNGAGASIGKPPSGDLQWDNSLGTERCWNHEAKRQWVDISGVPEQRSSDYLLDIGRKCSWTAGRWDVALSIPTTENASCHGVLWSTNSPPCSVCRKHWTWT